MLSKRSSPIQAFTKLSVAGGLVVARTLLRGVARGHFRRPEKAHGFIRRSYAEIAMTLQIAKLTLHEDEAPTDPILGPRVVGPEDPAAQSAASLGGLSLGNRRSASLARRTALHRRLLATADMASAGLALILVLSLSDQPQVVLAAFAGAALVVVLCKVVGLYDRDDLRMVRSTLDEVPLLAQLTGMFALGIAILQDIALAGTLHAEQIAAIWIVSFGAILTGRVAARALSGRTVPGERCLVIGEAERVDRIREKLASSQARAAVVASLPFEVEEVEDGDWVAIPPIIRRIVGNLSVDRIIIAPSRAESSGVVHLIRIAKAMGVRVSILPRIFEVVGSAVEIDDVDGMTMLGVRSFGLSRSSRLLKRSFDVVAASIGLLVAGPLISAIALAIRLDSHGPIFFRQVRVGRDGRHFRILKFRSMVVDAEARKDELRVLNEAGDGLFKISDDPRITRVGRFLRNTSLDELPQLFNVLRGEMSLVGPRPLVVDEDIQVVGLDRSRLHLTPGMTGPWQVMGARVPMQEMVRIDYLYVANWSLWLDQKILLRTVAHVLRRGNE
jgi:exopolysaccharide biosynthesis polyprenyl glycosylphosphotransferase